MLYVVILKVLETMRRSLAVKQDKIEVLFNYNLTVTNIL